MKRTFVIVIDHNPPQKVKPGEISQGSGRRDDDAVCRGFHSCPTTPLSPTPPPPSQALQQDCVGWSVPSCLRLQTSLRFFDVLARHLPLDIREIHENRKQHVKERVCGGKGKEVGKKKKHLEVLATFSLADARGIRRDTSTTLTYFGWAGHLSCLSPVKHKARARYEWRRSEVLRKQFFLFILPSLNHSLFLSFILLPRLNCE